jgi:hypothetical protein
MIGAMTYCGCFVCIIVYIYGVNFFLISIVRQQSTLLLYTTQIVFIDLMEDQIAIRQASLIVSYI